MRAISYLFLISGLLLHSLVADASQLIEQAKRYSPSVNYDVFRNGKPVGHYRIRFETESERLSVDVEMKIQTRIFGLFSYDYTYAAREVWQNDRLNSLEVSMLTNGDLETIEVQRQGDQLKVKDQKGGERDLPIDLLTTHHWFEQILQQREVLNTLTGKVSKIDVRPEKSADWGIGGDRVSVTGYRLGGELDNTLSWYDQSGVWRGMTFDAKDGSTIDVRWQGARL